MFSTGEGACFVFCVLCFVYFPSSFFIILACPGNVARCPVRARGCSPRRSSTRWGLIAVTQRPAGIVWTVIAPVARARGTFTAHEWPERVELVIDIVRVVIVAGGHDVEHRVQRVGGANLPFCVCCYRPRRVCHGDCRLELRCKHPAVSVPDVTPTLSDK